MFKSMISDEVKEHLNDNLSITQEQFQQYDVFGPEIKSGSSHRQTFVCGCGLDLKKGLKAHFNM